MQNGYFQLIEVGSGTGLALYKPQDGGEDIRLGELIGYLDSYGISYDRKRLEMLLLDGEDTVYQLGRTNCPKIPETYDLKISEDGMLVTARFFAASSCGERMSYEEFIRDLQFKKVIYGIQEKTLQDHFESKGGYCTDLIVAKGLEPVPGVDAKIEYLFDTDMQKHPELRADGSVDYFHLTVINQCRKGDVLARIIPEIPGTEGFDVYGRSIRPRAAKPAVLRFGRNIELSADKREISSKVDGHVALVDDKVFVSDVYEVQNVDVSTGNLEFEGSIQVNGDVAENFEVKAGGNVIVNGLVEGAKIVAGGDIIIAKGMNGMSKGTLRAGGNIIAKFLENTRVIAGGYVQADAILHSKVSSGSEVTVDGKKGLIVGGYVQAASRVTAKCIGASMGATTILEVGVNPLIKAQYTRIQKLVQETTKTVKDAEVILTNFKEKLKKGVQYNEAQLKYMKTVSGLVQEKSAELEKLNDRQQQLKQMMDIQKQAEVVVNDEIFTGTTIIIGDASRTIQSSYHYCKFVREQGEIRMAPL